MTNQNRVRQKQEKYNRSPINGTFELTGRCNLNCKMCYVHVDQKRIQQLGYRERTAEEWIDMARQVFEAGTFRLLLTGGEPILRPDFCEIYQAIAKMGFYITLYTNATLISPQIMEVLKRYPPHTLGITIYGVSSDTYKKVCGSSEAYDRMMEGLDKLLSLPSQIELRTTIIQDNLEEAAQIEKFIKSFGDRVTFNINQTVFQSGRNSIGNPAASRLSPEQNARFYCDRYHRMMEEYIENPEKLSELRLDQEAKERKVLDIEEPEREYMPYGCHAGYQEYTISWDGRLLPCSLFSACYTEPFEEGFEQAWQRLNTVIPKPVLPQQCRKCSVQQFCGVCPASRYCETGDVNGIPQYFCQLAETYSKLLK